MRTEPGYLAERSGGPKRSSDIEMGEIVPAERWIKAIGPAGTIVFVHTHGYHCGGRALDRDRIMHIGMFASSASANREHGYIECNGKGLGLDKEQAFALRASRK